MLKTRKILPPQTVSSSKMYAALGLTYLASFTVYLMTLAPTITFEDSGELTAAAYLLGVPHEPGYPLFTMLGHLFTYLPFGNIAYRVNLMSAFFSALGAMFVAWTAILVIVQLKTSHIPKTKTSEIPDSSWLVVSCGLCAGLLSAFSSENWEQSIITEVYGLNTFFIGLTLFLTTYWNRQTETAERKKYFYIICFVMGLALTNHPTYVLMIPVLFIYALIKDRAFILDVPLLVKGTGSLAAGLLPYAYLPLASARDPQMDWGNPDTWTNFVRVISRHQYQLGDTQSIKKFLPQLSAYGEMTAEQWWPWILVLTIPALWTLFRHQRTLFYLTLLFLFFTGPFTVYLTNFDITTGNPAVNAENKALVSVFYIPSYMMIAMLAGIGVFYMISGFQKAIKPKAFLILLPLLLPLFAAYPNYKKLDMSRYYFTEDYVENLFRIVPENSVVFVNWDPFIFPFNYYQYVEGRRTDVMVVDQELLRRSWYIRTLRKHHAAFMARAEKEVDEFLDAVRPFENKEKFDGNFIQSKYVAMINALIDRSYDLGNEVFMTYDPPAGIAQKYYKESVVAAVKLRKEMKELTPVEVNALQFRHLFEEGIPLDRMARFFKTYYGRLFFARGFAAENLKLEHEALSLYKKSLEFLRDNPSFAGQVHDAIQRLSNKPLK